MFANETPLGDWEEIAGSWVLRPPGGQAPEAIAHFIGGAFIGAAPQLSYKDFLEAMADQRVLVSVTNSLDTIFSQVTNQTSERSCPTHHYAFSTNADSSQMNQCQKQCCWSCDHVCTRTKCGSVDFCARSLQPLLIQALTIFEQQMKHSTNLTPQ